MVLNGISGIGYTPQSTVLRTENTSLVLRRTFPSGDTQDVPLVRARVRAGYRMRNLPVN